MSQVDVYRRILAAMPNDPEVVALCRKYIDKAESTLGRTQDKLSAVAKVMSTRFYDEEHAVTARDLADILSSAQEEDWSCRKASYYITRLVKEEKCVKVEEKGKTNRYYFIV